MKISELPTARLISRALELSGQTADKELDEAFCFVDAPEGSRFWGAVFEHEWLEAMAMQPHLFELETAELEEAVAILEGTCSLDHKSYSCLDPKSFGILDV
jgi:hypothetical protein